MYHVDLDLSEDEVQRLKVLALSRHQKVKHLVTELVKEILKETLTENKKKEVT